jgi:integrase
MHDPQAGDRPPGAGLRRPRPAHRPQEVGEQAQRLPAAAGDQDPPRPGRLADHRGDARTLDRFYAALREGGNARTGGELSASRVRDVHAILSGALGLAARYTWLPYNPALLAQPPAPCSARQQPPTDEEARILLEEAAGQDPELYLFLRLSAVGGLRRGEVCALRPCDVDLDQAELAVTGNVVFDTTLPDGFLRKPPKSENSLRLLALDAHTVELIRALLARHDVAIRGAGWRPTPTSSPRTPPAPGPSTPTR